MFDVYPLHDIAIVRAEGSYVFDSAGERYLDFYGGHAVISVGHTHPAYVAALDEQLRRIGFYSNSVVLPRQAELAEKLGLLSGREDYALFLCNSGAEANENALKLASFHTGRARAVAFGSSFHGRTSLAVAATDNKSIVAPINRTDHVTFLPYNDVEALEQAFAGQGGEIAAVIVEPIQGVGGIRVATDGFLKAIRSLCDRYGALMIADEIQCGCGRSGSYFALDHSGVQADIYTMAKGIGNGFPIGAVAIAPHIEARHGMLGTTFGGNPLACAAAIAVVDIMQSEKMIDNCVAVGDYLLSELRQLPGIAEVRGRGLIIGIEMPDDCTALRARLLHDEHIFVGASGKRIIRLLPALNITRDHADAFLTAFRKLL